MKEKTDVIDWIQSITSVFSYHKNGAWLAGVVFLGGGGGAILKEKRGCVTFEVTTLFLVCSV